jgi:Glycosyl-4,4'-diaponeurosporenoate acyltransferase
MEAGSIGSVILGIGVVVGGSVAIGAGAPRWPARWLERDRGPLRLLPGERVEFYRRLRARRLARVFPELGTAFGGVSKQLAPDPRDPASVGRYLIEVRRAEWVHWLSMLCWLPLPLFQPGWLAAGFLGITALVNGAALAILRGNKVRLYAVLGRG